MMYANGNLIMFREHFKKSYNITDNWIQESRTKTTINFYSEKVVT